MEIEVKFTGRQGIEAANRMSASVETHQKRGDTYVIETSNSIMENETTKINVRGGSRIVLTMPEGDQEVVYDAAQGAAIRKGSQMNDGNKADDPAGSQYTPPSAAQPSPTGMAPTPPLSNNPNLTQAQKDAEQRRQQQLNAQTASANAASTAAAAAEKNRIEAANKAKADEQARIKAQQESGAGRPPGESPPKPGSPVGSPPAGNEGVNNPKS